MTHGDFGPEYLTALVLGSDGRPRLGRVRAGANMLAEARAKAERRGWLNIDLENADATTLTPGWLNRRLGPEHGSPSSTCGRQQVPRPSSRRWPASRASWVAPIPPLTRGQHLNKNAPTSRRGAF